MLLAKIGTVYFNADHITHISLDPLHIFADRHGVSNSRICMILKKKRHEGSQKCRS